MAQIYNPCKYCGKTPLYLIPDKTQNIFSLKCDCGNATRGILQAPSETDEEYANRLVFEWNRLNQ